MTLEIGVDETFAESVADRLRSIEDRLGDAAFGRTPFVTEAASHIINAGGKRFRPLLVVLASRLYPGADDDAAERAALVVELTHVASLYHDDVMDEADLRRGAESANHRWSNSVSAHGGSGSAAATGGSCPAIALCDGANRARERHSGSCSQAESAKEAQRAAGR